MTIPDTTLMAYADGELEAGAIANVEAAIAKDPALATRVAAYRAQRARLGAAFEPTLHEPVPARLLAAARGIPVIQPRRRWAAPEFTAMAASLVLGVVGTWSVLRPASDPLIATSGSGLVARGALAQSLTDDLSGDTGAGPAQVGLSYLDRSGSYCRTFVLDDAERTTGIACRGADAWEVRLATRVGKASGEEASATAYRQAASTLPADVRRAIEDDIEGEILDADEEATARALGWRNGAAPDG